VGNPNHFAQPLDRTPTAECFQIAVIELNRAVSEKNLLREDDHSAGIRFDTERAGQDAEPIVQKPMLYRLSDLIPHLIPFWFFRAKTGQK
jgi:hypothetical protein